ncbi:MAG TPA: undecaprenyl-phosphate glucose phosphotransferase [Burkholderiales bacterium]
MLAYPHDSLPLVRSQPGLITLLRATADPVVIIAVLVAAVLWFEVPFGGPYLVLSFIVFSTTFPGNLGRDAAGNAELIRDVVISWSALVALLLLFGWASQTLSAFDRNVLTAWVAATPFALFLVHRLIPALLPRLLAAEGIQKTAVIAGAGELGQRLAERIRANPIANIRFAGFFDDRKRSRLANHDKGPRLGSLSQLADYAKTQHVDQVYITLPVPSQPRILELIEALHDTTASVYFVPDIFLFDLIQARLQTIGGIPMIAVCESPFVGISALIKRTFDIVLSSVILILIAPLIIAISVGVRLSSPGPILFRQRRYGLDGRQIIVYKFRSMRVIEDGAIVKQATRHDPRVTPFGAFLRKFSLDELPQFINVLQGRMSVVGPRPHALAHNEMYRKLIRGYMIRHKVRPGITGLAQVNGLRGETDTLEKMQARIECDLAYLRNWSLSLDIRIVLKTFRIVFGGKNAY